MCLFPMMGGMANMQPMVPPSAKGLRYKQYLYIIMACHIVLAILICFTRGFEGIFEFINVLILWCAIAQMHYCQLIIYMLLCGQKLVINLSMIGLLIQRGTFGRVFTSSNDYAFALVVMITQIIFYSVAIIVGFYAYREFKGMMFDNGLVAQGGIANLMGMGQSMRPGGQQQQNNGNNAPSSVPLMDRQPL